MVATHLIDLNELTPPQLCQYIEQNLYGPLGHALEGLTATLETALHSTHDPNKIAVISLLVVRLREEMEQLMRNDTLVVFPLIKRAALESKVTAPKLPLAMIRSKNERIMSLLERLRHLSNNYMRLPEWDHDSRFFFENLFQADQNINQCIFLKENLLMPKVLQQMTNSGKQHSE